MASTYLTLDPFKAITVAPAEFVDAIETVAPGWIDAQAGLISAWVDAQLRKRYDAPFASPYPVAVTGWVSRLLTLKVFLRRGVDATDAQFAEIKNDADEAKKEIKEAADAENGLYDLPLRQDTTASGISKAGPLSYSEQSPYVWADRQADIGRNEDMNRGGTGG
jgi:glutaredoxin